MTKDDFRTELQAKDDMFGQYRADEEGYVLFGFDDTQFEKREGGANDGTWIIPVPSYGDPTGPVSVRAIFLDIPLAWECTMGIDCHDPTFGVPCSGVLSSQAPDERLISFPIQKEAP